MRIYNKNVMEALRQNLGLNEDDTLYDKNIMEEYDKDEAFERFLEWHGMFDYAEIIKDALLNIYELEDVI